MAGNQLREVLAGRVASDPVTAALLVPLREAVRAELHDHLPRLAFSSAEAAEMLGVSEKTVGRLVAEGRLVRLADGSRMKITIGSILALVGWPMEPAPISAPMAAVPQPGAVS